MRKNKNIILYLLIALILTGSIFLISKNLSPASLTSDATILSVSDIRVISNSPELNYERAYLVNLVANRGGEILVGEITPSTFSSYGIDAPASSFKIYLKLEDVRYSFSVNDDNRVLYKIAESVGTSDVVETIPTSKVNLQTTKSAAAGSYTDPNNIAPTVPFAGSPPPAGDVNSMIDITKLSYWMPESSNKCYGVCDGNWWTKHIGGIPYYRGYNIDPQGNVEYRVRFSLVRESDGTVIETIVTQDTAVANIGDTARIKSVGNLVANQLPPAPYVDYRVVKGLEGTPVSGQFKLVSKSMYDTYVREFVNLVNWNNDNYAYDVVSLPKIPIVEIVGTPLGADVYIDNLYKGILPLTMNDIRIGKHTLYLKSPGYESKTFYFDVDPGYQKYSVELTKLQPPEATLSLSPAGITSGGSATLSWQVTGDISYVLLDNSMVSNTGSKTISPTVSTQYILSASGGGGKVDVTKTLTVSSPPRRSDPDVSGTALFKVENDLNNLLGSMYQFSGAPSGCQMNANGLNIICVSSRDTLYPQFQLLIKASWLGLQLPSGKPKISEVNLPTTIEEGVSTPIEVKYINTGESDSFDICIDTTPTDVYSGCKRVSVDAGNIGQETLWFSGKTGIYTGTVFMRSLNNPSAIDSKAISFNIIPRKLPGDVSGDVLPKYIEVLPGLIIETTTLTYIIIGVIIITITAITLRRKRKI